MSRRLGDILLERRLISPQALDHALREQQQTGELLGQALIRLGYLTEQQLLEGLAEHLQLPIVHLTQLTIDRHVMQTVPARLAWHYRCIPVALSGKTVTLAMSDPLQGRLVNDLKERHGLDTTIVLATEAEIQAAFQRCYGVGTDSPGEILEVPPQNGSVDARETAEPTAGIERAGEGAAINTPITRWLALEQLGLLPDDLHTLEQIIAKPHGVIFVTGPAGSGKTTTLYACLARLNTPDRKIVTLENAVDYESADLAIRMALTGRLVLATLSTGDAMSGVTRLLELGIAPSLLSSTLLAVLAQRLVRLICPDCKGAGCDACRMSGYRGRTGMYELLVVDEAIRRLLLENAPVEQMRARLLQQRWKTLRHDGSQKVALGQTTMEEVLRVTEGV